MPCASSHCSLVPIYFSLSEGSHCENLYETSYIMYSQGEKTELTGGEEIAKRENPYFNRTAEHFCSHRHTPNSEEYGGVGISIGKDGAYIGWQVFGEYADVGSLILKELVAYTLDLLLGDEKTIKTDLGAQGVTTLMKQGERYINHLLYASPVKRGFDAHKGKDIEIIEDLPTICDISVSLKLDKNVKRVYLAPQNKDIEFIQKDGRIEYTIDKLKWYISINEVSSDSLDKFFIER